ncbi:alpha/beta hydrolase [Paenibacillus sp. SYP-B3998]|uniref:Alpha/beta hydrolase n=1 Tax=Paenibacillus sp. SYP-B3998 TaxID=2678564 RepID=A0A6G3ZWR2_9BACL|nr:alpha/beta hydrolase [Paenibacillus sp. SYP-B3998]NEW06653.1 alpha/beta hydrolase [Paenibacillus sp. SYP-B3998]
MFKKVSSLLVALVIVISVLTVPVQAGVITNPNTGGVPGSWTKGTNPAVIDPNKPAILFVHGLNSNSGTWYDNNDMYQNAYNNGYQTAFINLYDITGTSQSMWDNGKLLAEKIKEISESFGKKLVIVAHSKGGVDTQTALVHDNAYPYVSNVITLSSPHYGSQLADLAYSSWASWLANLIGSQNPGTYSLQTSYMSYFRSITDTNANIGKNKFYTFAGNNWSTGSTAHFLGGLYLQTYGPNDGVVTVKNSYVPNGTMVKVGEWNHTTVKTGSYTFALLKPYLVLGQAAKADQNPEEFSAAQEKANKEEQTSQFFIRGGQLNGKATESFTVENNVSAIKLDWLGNKPLDKLEILAPDGSEQQVKLTSAQDDGVFKGAWHHTATISKPKVGEWKASAVSSQPGGYLFTVAYETSSKTKVNLQQEQNNKKLKLQVEGLKTDKTKITYTIDFNQEDKTKSAGKNKPKRIKTQESLVSTDELILPTSEGSGVYNVTAEIEGETAEGFKYRRTLLKSVYVDEKGITYTP